MIAKLTNALRHLYQTIFRRNTLEDDLAEEIRLHIEELAEDYERQGMSKQEAHKAARIRFGGTERIREECRDSWVNRIVSSFRRDTHLGIRRLIKDKGYSSMVLLSLSLGIGAAITIFSFLNAYLLKPLPYLKADRLTYIRPVNEAFGDMSVSYTNFLDWQKLNESFEAIYCVLNRGYNLTGIETPERLNAYQATNGFLQMLGAKPLHGRLFGPEESHKQAAPTAVLTHQFWKRSFESDPNAIGKTLLLDGELHTIIGILSQKFQYPPSGEDYVEIWTPIELMERTDRFLRRSSHWGSEAIGILKEKVTIQQARSDMERIALQLKSEYTDTNIDDSVLVDEYRELLDRNRRPGLIVLMAAVGCLLLIVCVNIAGLLAARAAGRAQEIFFRTALGAKRWDIIRQLLSENVILTALGAAGGLLVANWGVGILFSLMGDQSDLRQVPPILFDRNMILFSALVTLCSCLLFSLFPFLQSSLATSRTAMHGSTRTASSGRQHQRIRQTLVVAEIAMALVILSGAGLLLRSYQKYMNSDLGYNPINTLTMNVTLPGNVYNSRQKRVNFFNEFSEKTTALPGIQSMGFASNILGGNQTTYVIDERPLNAGENAPFTERTYCTSGFIQAMGMHLIQGRLLNDQDTPDSVPAALVDERFVKKNWPNENPIGKRFQLGTAPDSDAVWFKVVGVVSHIKHQGIDQLSRESVYLSALQSTFELRSFIIRNQGDPLQLIDPIRKLIAELDPNLAASRIRTLQRTVDNQSYSRRFLATILSVFAVTALLLAALGIYGVTAYSVNQRTQEFGIRMALGSRREDIVKLVLGSGAKMTLIGIVIGLIASFSFSSLIRSMIFGVSELDTITFIATTATLSICVLTACYLPARRAANTDPMKALRAE